MSSKVETVTIKPNIMIIYCLTVLYCRAALQQSDRKEPRYKWPTLLYFTFTLLQTRDFD